MATRDKLVSIFNAAVDSVSPHAALLRNLKLRGAKLHAGGRTFDLSRGRLFVVGGGKGAAPMAKALEDIVGFSINKGLVVVKYGHDLPLRHINIVQGAHPVPDLSGEKAAKSCLEIASECRDGDLLIVLLTGGASALLSLPAPGLSLDDLQQTTAALLACGANIAELNAVRKHLSALSGGRLAAATKGGAVLAIIVSDVIGDDLSVIASGPTVPDNSTFGDCMEIIARYQIGDKLPLAVMNFLRNGAAGKNPETCKADNPCFARVTNIIAAGNRQALGGAALRAEELGFSPIVLEEPMVGEAAETAKKLICQAKELAARLKPFDPPVCLLAGGETTVTIHGDGLGGRNQEMALAASIELESEPRINALFAGTDGTDGPTDAAGGFAHAGVDSQGAAACLANNDSYHGLKKNGDLFITGPTRTNVMDLAIILIKPPAMDAASDSR